MAAIFSLTMTIGGLLWSLIQLIRMPRPEPLSRWKVAFTLSCVAGLIALGVTVPIPWYAEAPFTIAPVQEEQVLAFFPGTLKEVHKRAGDVVQKGDVIAVLQNEDFEQKLERHQGRGSRPEQGSGRVSGSGSPARSASGRTASRIAAGPACRGREDGGRVHDPAPQSGVIVAAERKPEPTIEQSAERLSGWSGDPLAPRNIGSLIEARTPVCSIASNSRYEARLLIDQADRRDLAVGQPVRMKLEHLPESTLDGKVKTISGRSIEFVPAVLSNKYKGPLADSAGPTGAGEADKPRVSGGRAAGGRSAHRPNRHARPGR